MRHVIHSLQPDTDRSSRFAEKLHGLKMCPLSLLMLVVAGRAGFARRGPEALSIKSRGATPPSNHRLTEIKIPEKKRSLANVNFRQLRQSPKRASAFFRSTKDESPKSQVLVFTPTSFSSCCLSPLTQQTTIAHSYPT